MRNCPYDRVAFIVAAALLLGVSSAALAQSPSTASGQNSSSSAPSRQAAEQKFASYGLTDLRLKQLKNGWGGTAMKDGQAVKIQLRRDGAVLIK
jgi:hypothetical protein